MNEIKALNKHLEVKSEEIESMMVELMEREECACTLEGCAGKACGADFGQ